MNNNSRPATFEARTKSELTGVPRSLSDAAGQSSNTERAFPLPRSTKVQKRGGFGGLRFRFFPVASSAIVLCWAALENSKGPQQKKGL